MDHDDPDDYEARQRRADAEYERLFQEWKSQLSAQEITELVERGVDEPATGYCTHTPSQPDFSRHAAPEPVEPESAADHDANEAIVKLILILLQSSNVRLELECLGFLFGLSIQMGETQSDIARRHGICRAAVSKRIIELKKRFDVRPSRGMKKESAVAQYKFTNGQLPQCKP